MKKFWIHDREYTSDQLVAYCQSQLPTAPDWEKSHYLFILDWLSEKSFFFTYTSGSTGDPQPIKLSRTNMETSARMTSDYFLLKQGTKALLALPTNYIAGKMMIVRSLVCGWNLHWTEPKANPLLQIKGEFDLAAFTPMQVAAMLQESAADFNAIKKVLVGGGAVSASLEQEIQKCTNEVFATYGMTETITHVAIRPMNGPLASMSFKALPGVRFGLTSEGCLIIEAAHLGYQRIVTRDMVKLSTPLTFQYEGRADNVINTGGIKVFPEKVEGKISHLIAHPFFIYKESDDVLGERIVLYIERPAMSSSEELQLLSTIKLFVPSHKVPKKVYCVEKFDRTESDKIIRKNYI